MNRFINRPRKLRGHTYLTRRFHAARVIRYRSLRDENRSMSAMPRKLTAKVRTLAHVRRGTAVGAPARSPLRTGRACRIVARCASRSIAASVMARWEKSCPFAEGLVGRDEQGSGVHRRFAGLWRTFPETSK